MLKLCISPRVSNGTSTPRPGSEPGFTHLRRGALGCPVSLESEGLERESQLSDRRVLSGNHRFAKMQWYEMLLVA
jgi:hypothetical protein